MVVSGDSLHQPGARTYLVSESVYDPVHPHSQRARTQTECEAHCPVVAGVVADDQVAFVSGQQGETLREQDPLLDLPRSTRGAGRLVDERQSLFARRRNAFVTRQPTPAQAASQG